MSNFDVPFVFQFSDIVAGHGFFAHVATIGRGIVRQSSDGVAAWVVGVQPGSISGRAPTQATAFHMFRTCYQRTVFEFAASSIDFDAFKLRVDEFLQYIDDADTSRWTAALVRVRQVGAPPGPAWAVEDPPPSACTVTLIDKPAPRFNKLSKIAWAI